VGGTGEDWAARVATGPNDVIVVVGYFHDSIKFGPFTLTSAGAEDAFVVQYNSTGDVVWARSAGGAAKDEATAVTVLADGSVLVTGAFQSTATFAPTKSVVSRGESDTFLAKYDSSGNLVWVVRGGGTRIDVAWGVAGVAHGDVLVTGIFQDSADFEAETLVAAPGDSDIFVTRYDVDGHVVRAIREGGPHLEATKDIAALPDGRFALTGGFFGTSTTFGEGANLRTLTGGQYEQPFVASFAADGTLAWASAITTGGVDKGAGLAMDTSGNVYVTGSGSGHVQFGAAWSFDTASIGNSDLFVAKYGPSGDALWVARAMGEGTDEGTGLALAPDGTILVVGSYLSRNLKLGTSTTLAGDPNISQNILVARYATDGSLIWATGQGGHGLEMPGGVAALSSGGITVAGSFLTSLQFGVGPQANSVGDWDLFVARLDP
jgi:hypothetical protein